ncbi:hypothetical protein B5S28_g4149 [[Candida] boidinii]|nr:hypothetical protein B5S28_g4149 [[Candida] boidinii]OWB60428.1 hypothetical protein B5S29_g1302 [[Candida] boidinii]OWB74108.1 hypothetical protein B5S31_g3887 [[Candida] boidinii]OWB80198.1 hypothetical protein B5S32_g4456 [[Candida] boidinii]
MSHIKSIKLNTGASIPLVGLGTWVPVDHSDRDIVASTIEYAIGEAGYRHLDTAYYYETEDKIGEALKRVFDKGEVKREEVFITTKIWPTFYDKVEYCLDKSLKDLQLDYVDLLLVHYPVCLYRENEETGKPFIPEYPNGLTRKAKGFDHVDMWKQMEEIYKKGKAKAIGVSNYSEVFIEELLEKCDVVPAVNQIELHPRLPQLDLIDYCKKKGIVVTAFSPFGGGRHGAPMIFNEDVIKMAEKYNCSTGNILVNYHYVNDVVCLPKSAKPDRLVDNLKIIGLTDEDKKFLDTLADKYGILRKDDFPWGLDLGFEDKKPYEVWD